ncbi:MAG: DUF4271 domain-containing protein [Bacteroidota bacterium]
MEQFIENIRPLPFLPLWVVIVIFSTLLIVLFLHLYSPKILWLPFLSLVDNRVRRELIESRFSFQVRLLNLMDIIFYINFSLILYFLIKIYSLQWLFKFITNFFYPQWEDIILFFSLLFFSFIMVFIKKQVFLVIAHLFDELKKYYIFVWNINMLIKVFGIIMLPFVFMYSWEIINNIQYLIIILIVNTILYFIFILISFLEISHKSIIDYINFILYLCALEIIPLLFILKYTLSFRNG